MSHKKQHIIPETYLKYFSPNNDGKNIKVLFLQSPHKRKIESKNSGDSVFWKKDYYNSLQIKNPKLLELFLGQKIESNYNNLIYKISQEQAFDNNDFKIRFFEWVFYSKLRSPVWRIYIRRILQQNGYTFKNESIELREEHLKLFFRNDYFETVLKYYSDSLTFKRWVILISPANYTWITSDNPGFSFNYTNLKPDKTSPKINPLWTDIEYDTLLYFPLTRKYCLLIEPYKKNDDVKLNLSNDKINFKRSNVTETQIINSWTALSANEYILSSELIELAEFETFLNCT